METNLRIENKVGDTHKLLKELDFGDLFFHPVDGTVMMVTDVKPMVAKLLLCVCLSTGKSTHMSLDKPVRPIRKAKLTLED